MRKIKFQNKKQNLNNKNYEEQRRDIEASIYRSLTSIGQIEM